MCSNKKNLYNTKDNKVTTSCRNDATIKKWMTNIYRFVFYLLIVTRSEYVYVVQKYS